MGSLFEWITDWIKEGLIDAITGQYTSIFNSVNNQVADVANQVGQTPQGWNANIFSMIQTLSENVIVPIAGLVITYVLCYELISMVTEKNNMQVRLNYPNVEKKLANIFEQNLQLWETAIQKAKENGEMRQDLDVEETASMFWQVFFGTSFEQSFFQGLNIKQLRKKLHFIYSLLKA